MNIRQTSFPSQEHSISECRMVAFADVPNPLEYIPSSPQDALNKLQKGADMAKKELKDLTKNAEGQLKDVIGAQNVEFSIAALEAFVSAAEKSGKPGEIPAQLKVELRPVIERGVADPKTGYAQRFRKILDALAPYDNKFKENLQQADLAIKAMNGDEQARDKLVEEQMSKLTTFDRAKAKTGRFALQGLRAGQYYDALVLGNTASLAAQSPEDQYLRGKIAEQYQKELEAASQKYPFLSPKALDAILRAKTEEKN